MYKFTRFIFSIYIYIFNRIHITGKQNRLSTGSVIIYANHVSAFDIFLLTVAFKRPFIVMTKKEIFSNAIVRWFVNKFGAISVDRGHFDLISIRKALEVLKNNQQLGIFPEGTRSPDHPNDAKGGVAMFAYKTHANLIPVHLIYKNKVNIFNTYDIKIGTPISWKELGIDIPNSVSYTKAGDMLMSKLYEL